MKSWMIFYWCSDAWLCIDLNIWLEVFSNSWLLVNWNEAGFRLDFGLQLFAILIFEARSTLLFFIWLLSKDVRRLWQCKIFFHKSCIQLKVCRINPISLKNFPKKSGVSSLALKKWGLYLIRSNIVTYFWVVYAIDPCRLALDLFWCVA